MKLAEYIKDNAPRRDALAAAVQTIPDYLYQIATDRRKASHKMALAIEVATGGAVSKQELRPDIWGNPEKEAA